MENPPADGLSPNINNGPWGLSEHWISNHHTNSIVPTMLQLNVGFRT